MVGIRARGRGQTKVTAAHVSALGSAGEDTVRKETRNDEVISIEGTNYLIVLSKRVAR